MHGFQKNDPPIDCQQRVTEFWNLISNVVAATLPILPLMIQKPLDYHMLQNQFTK
jgi:hypothetical protein